MNAQAKRVDREDILKYIKELIEKSPDKEVELSVTDVAKDFGVTQPTMIYHINHLVKSGELIQTNKTGRYNRKVYKLPTNTVVSNVVLSEELREKLISIKNQALQNQKAAQHINKDGVKPETEKKKEIVIETPVNKYNIIDNDLKDRDIEEQKNEPLEQNKEEKINHLIEDNSNEVVTSSVEKAINSEVKAIQKEMEQREKTLDEKIDDFLMRYKAIPDPQDILKLEDKQILAVMNETIHQNMQYLRNLEDQLSTVENKQMILQLVDERAKLLDDLKEQSQKIKNLMDDIQLLKAEKKEKEQAIEPGRVRFMQQRILATLDDFVELPNHAMALRKHEFRKNMTKEINDLVRYVLGLEK